MFFWYLEIRLDHWPGTRIYAGTKEAVNRINSKKAIYQRNFERYDLVCSMYLETNAGGMCVDICMLDGCDPVRQGTAVWVGDLDQK